MKILIFGAGVIGITYGWQLSSAGQDVTIFVRKTRRQKIANEGIRILCRDERDKNPAPNEIRYYPFVVDEFNPWDNYDLIVISIKAYQLDEALPILSKSSGKADLLFFGNSWWGEEKIRRALPQEKYLFGFSNLVSGWRTDNHIECTIFDKPELITMLGEQNGQITPRLVAIHNIFDRAHLKPRISRDILGWLAIQYENCWI